MTTDPFADHLGNRLSERFSMMASMPPNSSPELWERLSKEVEKLEASADALLAAVRSNLSRAMDNWETAARPSLGAAHNAVLNDVGSFQEWLELNEPDLAALPDYLRGGEDE